MNNITRILIVEDLPPDYELAQREIRKTLKQCKFERAVKQRDFLRALEDFQPDLIVSDYVLPDFDGMKVLKLVQKHSPSTPVIIWTGAMGESVVVECLKQGAAKYVIKDDTITALNTNPFQFANSTTVESATISALSIKALSSTTGNLDVEGALTVRSASYFKNPVGMNMLGVRLPNAPWKLRRRERTRRFVSRDLGPPPSTSPSTSVVARIMPLTPTVRSTSSSPTRMATTSSSGQLALLGLMY